MKKIVAVLALCVFTQAAHAAGQGCRAIQGAGERLACYDAASLPKKDKPARQSDTEIRRIDRRLYVAVDIEKSPLEVS
jgi:hypothetical protein